MSVDPTSPTAAEEATLAHAARRGAPIVLAGHLISQLMGLGTLGLLCRLLTPADYGLLSAVLPAVMLPRMAAILGPGIAVLQQPKLSQQQLSSLFWLQAAAGAVAAIATTVICWLLAIWSQQPPLFALGVALAGGTLLAALGNQHQALLERNLRFGTGSALRLVAQAVSCVAAIAYAWHWPDVWALVVLHVAELAVLWLGSWLLAGWWPDAPQRASWRESHVRFSAAYSVSSLLQFLSQNSEKLLLPIFAGAAGNHALGLYSQAFGLMIKPVYLLTTPLAGVMISSLAKSQPGSENFTQLMLRFFRISALGLFPSAVGLTLVSSDVIAIVGGDQWQSSALLLRWLAPSLAAIGLMNLGIYVLSSRGQGRPLVIAASILLILTLQTTGIGYFFGQHFLTGNADPAFRGTFGIAVGFTLLNTCIWCGAFLWFTFRSVGVRPLRVALALLPSLRAALLMGLVVAGLRYYLRDLGVTSAASSLALSMATGMIFYSLAALPEILSLLRDDAKSKPQ
ncbi:Lipopolysaccharide biosynthesis protein WzxC [Anatilimnocola aggregata]|uniref:Lipopolysaccharide biosynthesis protein WzxC n=1 Tax=Anatilimnocola aggregata TaxID=2528021 RepID=A0A517YL19_9BACT|nr:oligosaccharide flippase family protein [Anatilimnocola aggregata]QDU30925.1 Lipopolysaccharide biosynthesis protein WzxC [Anatilimnocola aggregata]